MCSAHVTLSCFNLVENHGVHDPIWNPIFLTMIFIMFLYVHSIFTFMLFYLPPPDIVGHDRRKIGVDLFARYTSTSLYLGGH